MTEKWEPKIGDRCVAYHVGTRQIVTVASVFCDHRGGAAYFQVRGCNGSVFNAHRRQLRRLVKRERREWWLNMNYLRARAYFEAKKDGLIATTPQEGWLHVREVKP